MPKNVEIKAKVEDFDLLLNKVTEICIGKNAEILQQKDTFYNSKNGRLKLREFKDSRVRKSTFYF